MPPELLSLLAAGEIVELPRTAPPDISGHFRTPDGRWAKWKRSCSSSFHGSWVPTGFVLHEDLYRERMYQKWVATLREEA